MAERVQWTGNIPAGADTNTMWPLGSVPLGKKFMLSGMSASGGDAGERYGINLVPAGGATTDTVTSTAAGVISWLYPINGGTTDAQPICGNTTISLMIPGPCTLTIAAYNPTAAALTVNIVGYLEDL